MGRVIHESMHREPENFSVKSEKKLRVGSWCKDKKILCLKCSCFFQEFGMAVEKGYNKINIPLLVLIADIVCLLFQLYHATFYTGSITFYCS